MVVGVLIWSVGVDGRVGVDPTAVFVAEFAKDREVPNIQWTCFRSLAL